MYNGNWYREAWEDKKPSSIFARPPHPTFKEMSHKHLGLIIWLDKKLRRYLDTNHERHWPPGYFKSYLTDVFNYCLYYWDPEGSRKIASYFKTVAFRHVYEEFLQYESEHWRRYVDHHEFTQKDSQTQISYTFHDGEYHPYRQEPDDSWIESLVSFFSSNQEIWDVLTESLDQREKDVLWRYIYCDYVDRQIAEEQGLCRERARQIRVEAFEKIRNRIRENEGLREYIQVVGIPVPEIKMDVKSKGKVSSGDR